MANGHQPKAEWNGHYNARIYHPLITPIASRRRRALGTRTGDMLDGRLWPGSVGTADGAQDVILDRERQRATGPSAAANDRAQESGLCDVAMVRLDAGFPSAALQAGLEARSIDYVARLRANPRARTSAAPCMKRLRRAEGTPLA